MEEVRSDHSNCCGWRPSATCGNVTYRQRYARVESMPSCSQPNCLSTRPASLVSTTLPSPPSVGFHFGGSPILCLSSSPRPHHGEYWRCTLWSWLYPPLGLFAEETGGGRRRLLFRISQNLSPEKVFIKPPYLSRWLQRQHQRLTAPWRYHFAIRLPSSQNPLEQPAASWELPSSLREALF